MKLPHKNKRKEN